MNVDDDVMLGLMVDEGTYRRGLDYVETGRVLDARWLKPGTHAAGEVRGSGDARYRVSVRLHRRSSGQLSSFAGDCDCPVGRNCKHAVALFLTLADASRHPPVEPTAQRPSWEEAFDGLLDDPADVTAPLIGLLLEIVERRIRGVSGSALGVLVRPVVATKSSGWTTSGINWNLLRSSGQVPSFDHELAPRRELVRELVALHQVHDRRSWPTDDTIWLEDIASPRLWATLHEMRHLEIPLLASLKPQRDVTLCAGPATAQLELSRTTAGLVVAPVVQVDGATVAPDAVFIGTPVHAVAWMDQDHQMHLASFASPLASNLRFALANGVITIPAADEDRFLHDVFPRWPASLPVVSTDPTIVLPPRARATLVLSVTYEDEALHLLWQRGRAGTSWRGDLADDTGATYGEEYRQLVRAAVDAIGDTAPSLASSAGGARLPNHGSYTGLAAVHFAMTSLPRLETLEGIEVVRNGEWPSFRESLAVPVVSLSGGASDVGDWFDLNVDVSIEGEAVPFPALFTALAQERTHLVLPSGTFFSLERPEFTELRDLIVEARSLSDSSTTLRLSRYQADLVEDLFNLGIATQQAAAWHDSLRELIDHESTPVVVPSTLRAELRPYQEVGLSWLAALYDARLGGILADDMGLGKTLQAIALICHTHQARGETRPFLIVAPTSVVENWAQEAKRFAPHLRTVTVTETARRRGSALSDLAATHDLVVTSYALFRIEHGEYGAVAWAGLFLDEAQFAKNRQSRAYQTAKSLNVSFKVAMTGTPIENNLMELWSLSSIAAPGLFPHADQFEQYYRQPIERAHDGERLDHLRRRLRPFMLRRTKEEVAVELPEKQEQVLEMELLPRHRKIYETYLARERQKVLGLLDDMSQHRFAIFRSLTLLRQASLDVSLLDDEHDGVPSTKLEALMEMLPDIVADGHRVLIFSQFTTYLRRAADRVGAAGIAYCYLDGKTRHRAEVIDTFRQGSAPVFFISLKAGGFGLNLTEADYCFVLDPWWNPATEAQAVDRAHRIGQTRQVMVYRLVAKGTIEEKVMQLKAAKAGLIDSVLGGGEFATSALSANDIRDLLS